MGNDQTIPKRGDATHNKQSLQQFRVTGIEERSETIGIGSGSSVILENFHECYFLGRLLTVVISRVYTSGPNPSFSCNSDFSSHYKALHPNKGNINSTIFSILLALNHPLHHTLRNPGPGSMEVGTGVGISAALIKRRKKFVFVVACYKHARRQLLGSTPYIHETLPHDDRASAPVPTHGAWALWCKTHSLPFPPKK